MQVSPSSRSPCGPSQRERDEPAEREQRLVGRHVRGRLLAADVLLARLQREHEAALAVEVGRLADDPAGQPPDELRPRGEEAVVRARRSLVRCRRSAPRRSPCAQPYAPGRLEHAERGRGRRVRRRAPRASRAAAASAGAGLEAAEEVRLLEEHRGRVVRRRRDALGVGRRRRRAGPRRPRGRTRARRSSRPGAPAG